MNRHVHAVDALQALCARPGVPPAPLIVSRFGAPLLCAQRAVTFMARLRGLHALPPLGPNDALLISPCRAVHTWLLGMPIDVAFLDSEGRIVQLDHLMPNRQAWCPQAYEALEMACGTANRLSLSTGQMLQLESVA